MKDFRSEKAKARDDWMESKDGKSCLSSDILFSPDKSQYLKNRIEHAWCDGWDAAIKYAKQSKKP